VADKYLTESDVWIADFLRQVFAVDAVEPMSWMDAVHAAHASNAAETTAPLVCHDHNVAPSTTSINKLASYGTGGRLLLTANFKVT